jgi:hypothetical protein
MFLYTYAYMRIGINTKYKHKYKFMEEGAVLDRVNAAAHVQLRHNGDVGLHDGRKEVGRLDGHRDGRLRQKVTAEGEGQMFICLMCLVPGIGPAEVLRGVKKR